jgi:hypothetical protein
MVISVQNDRGRRGLGPRYSVGGEYYQIFLWSGASEEAEFFTEKMVTNEKRPVRKLSGAVHI